MKDLFENKKEVQKTGHHLKGRKKKKNPLIYNINPQATPMRKTDGKPNNVHNLSGNMFLHFVSSDFEIRLGKLK